MWDTKKGDELRDTCKAKHDPTQNLPVDKV